MTVRPLARWPQGPATIPALIGMLIGNAVAFIPQLRGAPILSLFFKLGVAIFRSASGIQVVMLLAWMAHLLEAMYMVQKCRRDGVSRVETWKWFLLTFTVGFPAIQEFNTLKNKAM
ncbi:hypothetical protein CEUSTIGMA_g567.t1 [Chlamydomonas eustigma]|uniref:Uncharacterized protein n=1 Tax=Chlamydomonas eustigma TaxID=1157962 RepID=A0A250WQI4_9CHLO|nr:hypothetical protein CEUSTIGMA_g567.t1 [Chlamydomonas eustigma]|eukprot:GAX73114.1 hypothetical protein CEUSTIGMA_g567.t1 [Chlamydomonas eustigma]